MNIKNVAISLILAIALISGNSAADDGNGTVDDGISGQNDMVEIVEAVEMADTTDIAEPAEPSAPDIQTALPAATSVDLEGIWILNTDDGQISMVLYQSEDILFGAANSEAPAPWNGVVTGSVFGDMVRIQILNLRDGVLVSTVIAGPASDGTIAGSLVQSDSQGRSEMKSVMGILINPDTSGYTPATVPVAAPAVAPVTPTPETPAVTAPAQETTADGRMTPVDVTIFRERFQVGAGAPIERF
ncbi:hypothetical protein [Candidatus Methanocrinis natronophilus]|uniref:S1 motif domain-containing protein n=1 Tax=Candidatus Methanocrinis natronophilus TaxID=3033396 RepID=A0ABT5X7A0_9EURY|nr:hypothetical protein [Candidatus Methanocrinis natronophilus]MDF0590573.1 hypothetical protein [Candidatus Methanocrinis natronophilus]